MKSLLSFTLRNNWKNLEYLSALSANFKVDPTLRRVGGEMATYSMPVTAEYIKYKKKVEGGFGMSSWRNHCAPLRADNADLFLGNSLNNNISKRNCLENVCKCLWNILVNFGLSKIHFHLQEFRWRYPYFSRDIYFWDYEKKKDKRFSKKKKKKNIQRNYFSTLGLWFISQGCF